MEQLSALQPYKGGCKMITVKDFVSLNESDDIRFLIVDQKKYDSSDMFVKEILSTSNYNEYSDREIYSFSIKENIIELAIY